MISLNVPILESLTNLPIKAADPILSDVLLGSWGDGRHGCRVSARQW